MQTFADLRLLTADLLPVLTLAATDFSGTAPNLATLIHFGLTQAGAEAQMVTLWKKTNIATIGELQKNGKPLYHIVRGGGAQNAHFYLNQIADLLNNAGLILLFDIRGLVDFPTAAPLLRGKKIVWTLESAEQLADANALTVIGEPPLNLVVVTPTEELATEVKQHPVLKNVSVVAIPSGGSDDCSRFTALTLYLQLCRRRLALVEITAEQFSRVRAVAAAEPQFYNNIMNYTTAFSRQYRYADSRPPQNSAPIVIWIGDGKRWIGGLADRLGGIVFAFQMCRQVGRDFKIHFVHPFRLTDYLQPNQYNWTIAPEAISYHPQYSQPVMLIDGGGGICESRWRKRGSTAFIGNCIVTPIGGLPVLIFAKILRGYLNPPRRCKRNSTTGRRKSAVLIFRSRSAS
ncbi:MAG: hypothetical protein LBP75_09545 [Planctomycetota bacterium]|jgi:hypothetical protein|nr:hypothetical protein [Planctomycetota bacterium]